MAPLVVLSDAHSGAEIDGGFFKLDVLSEKTDMFNIRDLLVTARFYPDHIVRNGMEDTASMEIRKPAFNLAVQKDSRVISQATLRPGETMRAGDYLVSIPSMRYWVRFLVVKEYGVPLVYGGFGIATFALIWRLVFFRREVRGQLQEAGPERAVLLSGRAEFYRDLFEDEFQSLVSSITSEGSDPKKPIGASR